MKTTAIITTLIIGSLWPCGALWAEEPKTAPEVTPPAKVQTAPTYPLDTCVVSGEKLGAMGEFVKYDHNGREIRFCCQGCVATFKQNPDKYLKILDEAVKAKAAAAQAAIKVKEVKEIEKTKPENAPPPR